MSDSPPSSRSGETDKEDSTCTSSCFGVSIICKTKKSKVKKGKRAQTTKEYKRKRNIEKGDIYI